VTGLHHQERVIDSAVDWALDGFAADRHPGGHSRRLEGSKPAAQRALAKTG
jgi:hypothetical protein